MSRTKQVLAIVAAVVGIGVARPPASEHDQQAKAPIFGIKIPAGYRDWMLVSVAHEEGNLNDIRAILGNDIAIKAYREGTFPFQTA